MRIPMVVPLRMRKGCELAGCLLGLVGRIIALIWPGAPGGGDDGDR